MNSIYIINECNKIANNLYPCLKQQVYAMIITKDGNEYFGANWMLNNTITICPRVTEGCPSGTGYDLCESVCGQGTLYHAERQAINHCKESNGCLKGATLYLTGHTYCCDTCTAAMKEEGITKVIIL